MDKKFTNLLVKYVHHEVTHAEKLLLEDALDTDWELYELYNQLKEGLRTLPKVTFSPKKSTIQNILRYSNEQLEPQF